MNMKTKAFVMSVPLVLGTALAAGALQKTVDPRILAYDKGPATIDVSSYPQEMQQGYKVFQAKCSKCHTLARAINSDFALDGEWERYIKRMMRKASGFISKRNGKKIFEFLVYDSKTRKKDLYERKLKEKESGEQSNR